MRGSGDDLLYGAAPLPAHRERELPNMVSLEPGELAQLACWLEDHKTADEGIERLWSRITSSLELPDPNPAQVLVAARGKRSYLIDRSGLDAAREAVRRGYHATERHIPVHRSLFAKFGCPSAGESS